MSIFSSKRSLEKSGIFQGFTDCHSHILPGVDDGIQTMDDSLAVLQRYEELGFAEVWLTPHIMEDIPNTTARLRARYEELKVAYHGPITLHLAAENMMDTLFEKRLAEGDILPFGQRQDSILVETSYFNGPQNLFTIIDSIFEKGYFPILAHPERYLYMDNDDYQRLHERGVRFQSNITSFAGAYGLIEKKKAEYLLSQGWLYYLGTDIHRLEVFNRIITANNVSKKVVRGMKELLGR